MLARLVLRRNSPWPPSAAFSSRSKIPGGDRSLKSGRQRSSPTRSEPGSSCFTRCSDPLYIDAAEAVGVSLVNLERAAHARVAKRLETLARRLEKAGIRAESAVH